MRDRSGTALGRLCGRPAALVSFLEGVSLSSPGPEHCREVGVALARLHAAGRDFPMVRENSLSVASWRPLFAQAGDQADSVSPASPRAPATTSPCWKPPGRRTCRAA